MNDKFLKRFVKLSKLKKQIEAEYDKSRKEIIDLRDLDPTCDGTKYTVMVNEIERTQIAGLEDIKDTSMKVYDALMKLGLIRAVKQKRVTVKERLNI